MKNEMQVASALEDMERDGFCGPFDLDTPEIVDPLLASVLAADRFKPTQIDTARKHVLGAHKEQPLLLSNEHISNAHVMQLAHDSAILSRLRAVMGDEVYLRRSQFWRKPLGSRGVIWHQDKHEKMGLGTIGEYSAWVALEDTNIDNGCVWLLKGSHKAGFVEPKSIMDAVFRIRFFASDALEIPDKLSSYEAVPMQIKKGQFFLFHQMCFHASGPNKTQGTRTGLAYRYLTDSKIERITEELTRVI